MKGAIVLLACFAAGAFAATDTLQLQTAGAGYVMGGVYTSPYGISINGGAPTLLICDDFTTDISLGQTWFATVTSLADLQAGTGTPKFTPVDIQNYATAGVLAAELMSLPNLYSEAAGEISYAIWGIFDTTLLNSMSNPYGTITQKELDAAKQYLMNAENMVAGATTAGVVDLSKISINGQSINGLTIYTPSGPNGLNSSQEFLQVSMPEPSYPAVLAVDLLAVVGLMVVLRRRITGIFS
ncbi:MAG: hypothetical protein LAQ69_42540 [Acidobacteriia bacterium]|nr:hypothetical protein [Terriglobia bacterium]